MVSPEASAMSAAPAEARRSTSTDTDVWFRCILFHLGLWLLGTLWVVFAMFHHFDFVSDEVKRGSVVRREVLVDSTRYTLSPNEERTVQFSVPRPAPEQACHLVGEFGTDSSEGQIAVGLERGPPAWEAAEFCGFPGRFAYTNDLDERRSAFSAPIEFADDRSARGCISVENKGKKSTATVDITLSFVCLARASAGLQGSEHPQ
jgi:hypothetical protein